MLDPQSPALTQHYYYRNVTLLVTGATGFWRVWTSKCLAWGKRWRGSSRWDTCLTLWTGLLLVLLKYPCLVLSCASPAGWLWSEMSVNECVHTGCSGHAKLHILSAPPADYCWLAGYARPWRTVAQAWLGSLRGAGGKRQGWYCWSPFCLRLVLRMC